MLNDNLKNGEQSVTLQAERGFGWKKLKKNLAKIFQTLITKEEEEEKGNQNSKKNYLVETLARCTTNLNIIVLIHKKKRHEAN